MFAARDRFGIKPLYYTVYDGTFYLASEVKAFAELGVPLQWDRETLYDMHFVTHAPDRSLFQGIYQLPPGSYLDDRRRARSRRAVLGLGLSARGDDTTARRAIRASTFERFAHEFEEAVRLRLRADVPVACYLSGGIDSCTVLGFASQAVVAPAARVHAVVRSRRLRRSATRRGAGEALSGASSAASTSAPSTWRTTSPTRCYHAERPFANAHVVAKYLLSRAVRDSGIKVVMTGEGSDEILAGYPHFRRDAVMYGQRGRRRQPRGQQLLAQLEASNRVSAGLLMPRRDDDLIESVRRAILGFVPSQLETGRRSARVCCIGGER